MTARHFSVLALASLAASCASPKPLPVFGPVIVLHPPAPPPHPRVKPSAVTAAAAVAGAAMAASAVLPVPPPPPPPAPQPVAAPPVAAALDAAPDTLPEAAAVLANFMTARQLAAAYVAAPGATLDGLRRARVLDAAASRAIVLLLRHRPPSQLDADNAAAAIAELINLVR